MQNNQLTVETPLGGLLFGLHADEGTFDTVHISECDIEPDLPKGMSVEGCKAVLARCTSAVSLKGLIFSCSWQELKEEGYSNTGEGLDAWEWEYNKTLVMVGTEDDQYLGSRINLKKSSFDDYPITMNNNVIKIHVSEFPANEALSLHFIISWNSLPEKVDCSCWYAVDISHEKVLQVCK